MEKLYQPTLDGLCGDEDNGQTSAWYVFSAMGFYPVCPASTGLFHKHTKTYLTHEHIVAGVKITFEMGEKPNPSWGAAPEDAPYSMSAAG
jgi:putative alpha-1,2-mannosidase